MAARCTVNRKKNWYVSLPHGASMHGASMGL